MTLESRLVPLDDEEAYRKHHLRADFSRALIVFAVLGIAGVVFIRQDLELVGRDDRGVAIVINRILTACVFTYASIALGRAKDGKAFDRAIVTLLIAIVLSAAHVTMLRIRDYVVHLPVNLLLTMVLWFVMPGPLVARGVAAIALSAVSVYSSLEVSLPMVGVRGFGVANALTHVMGLPIALQIVRLRREHFKAQLAEERIRLQLIAEKERAESLAHAKSDFLATMSHEFRTPMNAVVGLSEVLLHSNLPPRELEHVATIHRSAEGLLVLLNDILDLAKIDARRMTLELRAVELRELVDNAVTTVRYRAEEKQLLLKTSFASAIPRYIWADGVRLRQILVNLLSNAVKFTDTGTVHLSVDERDVKDGVHQLVFRLVDTGSGISDENLKRIFLPFEQTHERRIGNQGGTGLGLSISLHLAQLMGGSITATSTLGRGSTFELAIPAKEAKSADIRASRPEQPDVAPAALRILVAEDNTTNQHVALTMLERLGYVADVVGNGQLAVDKVTQTHYDVILMDRHMPELDGIEATRRIRGLAITQPHIVAMTASAYANDRTACIDAGMDDFVAKPVRLDELHRVLSLVHRRDHAPASVKPILIVVPAEGQQPPIFDAGPLEVLRTLAGDDNPGFLENLCNDFIQDSATRIDGIPDLIARGDVATLERDAHSMKSASASVGALRMSAIAARIEALAERGDLGGCTPLVGSLKEAFLAAKVRLEEQIAKTPTVPNR